MQARMDERVAQISQDSNQKISQVESLLRDEKERNQYLLQERVRMTACVEEQQSRLQQVQYDAEREKEQLTQAHRAEAAQALRQSQQVAQEAIDNRDFQNQALLGQQQRLQEAIQLLEQQRAHEMQRLRERTLSFQEQQKEIMETFKFREITANIGPKRDQEHRKAVLREKLQADLQMVKGFEDRITKGLRESIQQTTTELAEQRQQMRSLGDSILQMSVTTTRTATAAPATQQQRGTASGSGQGNSSGPVPSGPPGSRGPPDQEEPPEPTDGILACRPAVIRCYACVKPSTNTCA